MKDWQSLIIAFITSAMLSSFITHLVIDNRRCDKRLKRQLEYTDELRFWGDTWRTFHDHLERQIEEMERK